MTTKVYAWSLFTRLFHLLLVVAVVVTYLLSDIENLLEYHVAFGLFVGALFFYRLLWGFMDIRYSRFKDFEFSLGALFTYLLHIGRAKTHYVGHNPASSWAIVMMIVLGLLSVVSGLFVYGTQEGMGIFSFLNDTFFKEMELFEELHELFANAFVLVAVVHVSGVLIDRYFYGPGTMMSMVTGYKESAGESVRLTLLQRIFGLVWIISSLLLLSYLLSTPSNFLMADGNRAVDYKTAHPLFYSECKSCHTLYPPYLLPKRSWSLMMDTLEEHFGDDASLEPEEVASIRDYLLQNSAESSTKEAAFRISSSITDPDLLAITKTPYWKMRHHEIEKTVFEDTKVQKRSNCKACHNRIEQGLLNDKDIKLPL